MPDTRLITARSLLLGFLDLRNLTRDLGAWTEDQLSGNLPRLIRLRRLVAMFRAFNVPWDPASFVKGKFIQSEQPRYAALLSKLDEEIPCGPRGRYTRHVLPEFFAILFDYRTRVDDVLTFSSGVLEASGLYFLAYRKVEDLNKVVKANMATVEDLLVARGLIVLS